MKIEIRETKVEGWVQITTIDERFYRRESDGLILPSATWILNYYPKGKQYQQWRDKLGGAEADEVRDEAGRKGGRVHNAIAALIYNKITRKPFKLAIGDVYPDNEGQLKEFTADEWKTVITFVDWWTDTQPTPIAFEHQCWNETDGYAGTIDFICEIAGERYVVDFKTSKSIWPSHELQVASYCKTPQGAGCKGAILQIGYTLNKRGWKFTEVEELDEKYVTFLATMRLWWNENKNVQPKQYEYPATLELTDTTKQLEASIKKQKKEK
jgi:hypothetical protein